ncbi:MAG: NAD-dependent epimerase/dehydratase family protein [Sulfuritalea sp.]|nr:NAD-dependent epimerase/dehydratase family protein [Sulfuritalea sp.]
MSKILITGGAGFIGSHLSRILLTSGHSVRILDNLSPQIHGALPQGLDWLMGDGVDFIRGSITDEAYVRTALQDVDSVVHLAAETGTGQSMYQIAHYNNVNVGGTALLLDILANDSARSVKRIVLASSRSIYGEGAYVCSRCDKQKRIYPNARIKSQLSAHRWEHACEACSSHLKPVPTREDDPAKPASIYAATKYAQEDLVRVACAAMDMDYTILRLQNVYGEGQSLNNPYTGILSIFSTRIRRKQHLPIFEDGLETRDFVHVQDVANAFLAAVEFQGNISQAINVGMGVKTTVAEIAGHLSDAFGVQHNLVTTHEYRLGDIRHNFADTHRLQCILGNTPQIDLNEGMLRFAEWVTKQVLSEDQLDKANAQLRTRNLMG